MDEKNKITGIILAGGKSSRMGFDKGLAEVSGIKMIDQVYEALKKVVDKVIIVSNNDSYHYLGLPVFEDIYKEIGPIGGIYTGLFNSSTEKNIIIACDMPFITSELLVNILEKCGNNQIVVPCLNDKLEPLCGFYKKEILEQLKELIEMDVLSVHRAIEFFDHLALNINKDEINTETVFTNINRQEDIEQIEKSARRISELSNDSGLRNSKINSRE